MRSGGNRTRLCLLGSLVLGVLGCGLGDYEARMAEAQKRWQRLDEESKLLDVPINVPHLQQEKGPAVPLAQVFFRPPKGISDQFDMTVRDSLFYAYRPRAKGAPGAGSVAATAGPFSLVELAFGEAKDKDFAANVVRSLERLGQVTSGQRRLQAPLGEGSRDLVFDTYELDHAATGAYVALFIPVTAQESRAAVAYWIAPGQKAAAQRALQLSLESFGLDAEVPKMRADYQQALTWTAGR